jgi:uncharacterized YigZ family protein
MLFEDTFRTIENTAEGDFRDRGSRFIGIAFHVKSEQEVRECIQLVKKNHPKANHHCYGFRLGPGGSVYRYSDDREPSGSAGKPIYGSLLSNDLTDILIVVARYFGGTLLGVPGLINAYREAAAQAVAAATIITVPVTVRYKILFSYDAISEVMAVIKKSDAEIVSQEMNESCSLTLSVPKSASEKFYQEVLSGHTIRSKCKIESL